MRVEEKHQPSFLLKKRRKLLIKQAGTGKYDDDDICCKHFKVNKMCLNRGNKKTFLISIKVIKRVKQTYSPIIRGEGKRTL